MKDRRRILIPVCVIVMAVVLVVVGRSERSSEQRHNLDGIAFIRSLVGTRVATPDDYRVSPDLYCLLYDSRGRVFALELCADQHGRLVEAVDRRGSVPVFYSVTSEPGVARDSISLGLVSREITKLQQAALRAALQRGTARRRAHTSTR
jgi:hypothetical protein